ncbi:MAG: 50S ribosomal protein L22 [Phycisphaeraceae bacterium]|nr:50S ribosomal protein L22 [Phycisphaeraceae bacterium]
MAYQSTHRGARISATKVRPVLNMVRGKALAEALSILEYSPKRAAVLIRQVLLSAQANADQKEADVRRLVVVSAYVDVGPTIKRFQPKDRGRAHQILKRTSHITVALDQK